MKKINANAITLTGLLAALSTVLTMFFSFPIFPSANYLKFDFGDTMCLIAAVALGPIYGLVTLFISAFLQSIIGTGGPIGFLMHMVASTALILVPALVYKKYKTNKSLIIGLVLGCATMTLVMIPMNMVLTPIFTGIPLSEMPGVLVTTTLFNLVKSIGNSIVFFIIFKLLHKQIQNVIKN